MHQCLCMVVDNRDFSKSRWKRDISMFCVILKRFQPSWCYNPHLCLYPLLPFKPSFQSSSFLFASAAFFFFCSKFTPSNALLLPLSALTPSSFFYTSKLSVNEWSVWWVSRAYSLSTVALPLLPQRCACWLVYKDSTTQENSYFTIHIRCCFLAFLASLRCREELSLSLCVCLVSHVVRLCIWFLLIS